MMTMKITSNWTRNVLPTLVLAMTVIAMSGPAFAQAPAAPSSAAPKPASATGAPVVPGAVEPPPGYVIGPEDLLTVVFWREKDLSTDVAVRPDGMITVPLLNDVQASGLTPDALRERIQAAATKFVTDPSVTVVVKAINSRKVFITGNISKPGQYPLAGPTSVMQLIAMAGGLQEFADADRILIMRTESGKQIAKRFNYEDVREGKKLDQNIDLQPGDTVIVP
jgi:polysaccharide biosynthesis/export protein